MGPTAKGGLIFAMLALLLAGQLIEREFRRRREAAKAERKADLSVYADLFEPLEDARLPRAPRGEGSPEPEAAPRPARAAAGPVEGQPYVIRPGDTLAKIARKVYGSEAAWKAILDGNRALIPDPARLQVGSTLRIPPRSKPAGPQPR